MTNEEVKKLDEKSEKIAEEIEEVVSEEVKDKIPESKETKSVKAKEKAADEVAKEVAEESKDAVEAIAKDEVKAEKNTDEKVKTDAKKGKKKAKEAPAIPKKDEAVAKGVNLHTGMKTAKYICAFIKGKNIDKAIADLEEVKKMKIAVPYKGEIPHRKGVGMMSGRYPVKASGMFIKMLKGLKGNVIVNGMDLDKCIVCEASASWAARPMRRGGKQAKRTNVILKAKEFEIKSKKGGKK